MTILSTLFYIIMAASLFFSLLNVIMAMIRKKTFRMLVNFVWILLIAITAVTTWLYFQGFLYSNYYGWLPEFDHLMFGVQEGLALAKISLYSNIICFVILLIYIIVLINRMIRGVNRAVDKTADSISNGIDAIKEKSPFKKKEETEEITLTTIQPEPRVEEPIELKLDEVPTEEPAEEKQDA